MFKDDQNKRNTKNAKAYRKKTKNNFKSNVKIATNKK